MLARMRFIVATALAAIALISALTAVAQQNPIPEKFTNLQVMPKDVSRAELTMIMRMFAMGLGVRCEHCHVGEGNDLSKFDFAADTKAPKATARQMMRMVLHIQDDLKGIGDPARMPKVTCYTCHRGQKMPATAAPPG